jgi:hypothetical protein
VNGYLTRLLARTRSPEQLVRPRPVALFGQPIAGPEWRLNSPARDGVVRSKETEGTAAEPPSDRQRSQPVQGAATRAERPVNTEASRLELHSPAGDGVVRSQETEGTAGEPPSDRQRFQPVQGPAAQAERSVNMEASRLELRPREAPENRTVAPHIAAPPPSGGHTLQALELGLTGHTKYNAGTSIGERELPEQTLRPGDPTFEPRDMPRPAQAPNEEHPPLRRTPQLGGVQRLDPPPPLPDPQLVAPVRAHSGAFPAPATSHPALLGKRPASPVEVPAERTASPQAIRRPAPIRSASAVRPRVVDGDGQALPPLVKRIKPRAAGNLPEPATVHVTIGTLEVRANTMPSQPRAVSAPTPQAPRLSLSDYLRQRRERGQG